MSSTEDEVRAAYALLLAATLMRDVLGAMPPAALVGMPRDIRSRMQPGIYQAAFDGFPPRVRHEAREMFDADPDVIEARAIHERGTTP